MLERYLAGFDLMSGRRLERCLEGLMISPNIKFNYSVDGDIVTIPSYVLPVDTLHDYLYGFFNTGQSLTEVKIGFRQKTGLFHYDFYTLDRNGEPRLSRSPDPFVLYLPLFETRYCMDILNRPDAGADSDISYRMFGLKGTEFPYPLVMAYFTQQGFQFRSIYQDITNDLGVCVCSNFELDEPGLKELGDLYNSSLLSPDAGSGSEEDEPCRSHAAKAAPQRRKPSGYENEDIDWHSPQSIVAYLDLYVIGQQRAKEIIAVAYSNFFTSYLHAKETGVEEEFEDKLNQNLILIGPSGVGKTYLMQLLAKTSYMPLVKSKLTGKSTEGFKGENLSNIFKQIRMQSEDYAPYCMVFLDEVDKLIRKGSSSGGFGEELQQELIGFLDETTVFLDGKEDKKYGAGAVNTKNLLYITAGAFGSLHELIAARLDLGQKKIGFGADNENQQKLALDRSYLLPKLKPEDLIKYGLMAELVGRLPNVAVFDPLTSEDKIRILNESKGSVLRKYEREFMKKGYELHIHKNVSEVIASYCPDDTGARALESICHNMFTKILYSPEKYTKGKAIRVTPTMARSLIDIYHNER